MELEPVQIPSQPHDTEIGQNITETITAEQVTTKLGTTEPITVKAIANEPTVIGEKASPESIKTPRKPLEILRDAEIALRRPTVAAIVSIIPSSLSDKITAASDRAEQTLHQLANIDTDSITDWELRPARIAIGLSFVGFGALTLIILILYLNTLHGELTIPEQIGQYWYEYIWFVNLGVTGMFVLGREAMRQPQRKKKPKRRDYSYLKDKWD